MLCWPSTYSISRETHGYKEESEREAERVRKYEAEGRDEYDVNKQKAVAAESHMMIADCIKRLTAAVEDLEEVMETQAVDPASSEDAGAAVAAANDALQASKALLAEHDSPDA